jgi:hypothetical protein
MAQKFPRPGRTQQRKTNVSLAPLAPDQALAGLLRVKLEDVKKLEAAEAAEKKKGGKQK